MLHAASHSGVFPDAKTGVDIPSHRALAKEIVGEEIEQLMAGYAFEGSNPSLPTTS